ncbi:MAG: GGDEF domain-containing protein [Myxococcales bacterium]
MLNLREEVARLRGENLRLSALAYRDPLTGVRNRRCFSERLHEELCRLRRNPCGAVALLVVDLNDFKRLNDTRGHATGDAALMAVAAYLEQSVRAEDMVCRLGGDEFAILLPGANLGAAEIVAARLRQHARVLELGPRPLAIGAAAWTNGDDAASLLDCADAGMYADKPATMARSNAA